MSLIDFYCNGPSAEWHHLANTFKREINTTVTIEPNAKTTNPLLHKDRERIIPVKKADNNIAWIVDQAIKVTASHSDVQRKSVVDYWNTNYAITLTCGIVSTLLGIGSGVATFFVAATWLKVTCIVAAVALVLFAILSIYRSTEASDQAELWQAHPAVIVADRRTEAFTHGFEEMWTKNQNEVLTRNEVTYLHHEAFERWNKKLQDTKNGDDTAKAAFVEQFVHSSLLHPQAITLALGKEPHNLTPYYNQYKALCINTSYPDRYFREQQTLVDQTKDQLLAERKEQHFKDKRLITDAEKKKVEELLKERENLLSKLTPEQRNNLHDPAIKRTKGKIDKIEKLIFEAQNDAAEETRQLVKSFDKFFKTYQAVVTLAHTHVTNKLSEFIKKGYFGFYSQSINTFRGAYATLNKKSPPAPYPDAVGYMKLAINERMEKEATKATTS